MNGLFILKQMLSFVLGAVWIVAATVMAEKLGPRAGGLISGLPSTVMLGLFFLAWTQNPGAAVQATTVIPIVAGINSLFLVSYVFFVKTNFWRAVLFSLALWLILAYLAAKTRLDNFLFALLGYSIFLLLSFYLMEKAFRIGSIKGKTIRHTPEQILARALMGGLTVSLAVYLGKIGGPTSPG